MRHVPTGSDVRQEFQRQVSMQDIKRFHTFVHHFAGVPVCRLLRGVHDLFFREIHTSLFTVFHNGWEDGKHASRVPLCNPTEAAVKQLRDVSVWTHVSMRTAQLTRDIRTYFGKMDNHARYNRTSAFSDVRPHHIVVHRRTSPASNAHTAHINSYRGTRMQTYLLLYSKLTLGQPGA